MISAYIKLSEFCSVGCDHCYLPEDIRKDKRILTDDEIYHAAQQIVELAKHNQTNKVMLLLHGGEPMSLDPAVVERKMWIIKNTLKEANLLYRETVQSSILTINDQWIEMAHKYWDSFIGFSIDFTSRTIRGSADTYIQLLEKRLDYCKKNKITLGATYVPSKKEIGREREIIQWFAKNEIGEVTTDRYSDFGSKDPNKPSNREFSEYLINFTSEIINRLKCGEFVSSFSIIKSAIRGVQFGVSGERWGTTCSKSYIVVGQNGKTNNCPDKISYEKSYSQKDTFVLSEDRMNSILTYQLNHDNLYCNTCEYNVWCKTGCPIMSNNIIEEGDCSGYKLFLNYIKEQLQDKEVRKLLLEYSLNE